MLKGFYPGTFDPPTFGHLEIISRAADFCEHLLVGVGKNWAKEALLTVEERVEALKRETKTLKNVEILPFSGLAASFAKENGANVLIRGLRSGDDIEFEKQMATANKKISGLETLFLIGTKGEISATLIRELASCGAPLGDFTPSHLEGILHKRIQERKTWTKK
jgi:pantetheine-phosphate adenylyltransferase